MNDPGGASDRTTIVDTVFRRLFENEFATLDGIAISHRGAGELDYIDEGVALGRMLGIESAFASADPTDPAVLRLHEALLEAWPEGQAVVSGWSRHLMALLDEAMPLPACTSMMRKRGVTDLAEHLVDAEDLVDPALIAAIAGARGTADRNEMAHLLLATTQGFVVVAAPTPIAAMAHWHNVEFAARVECLRVEEAAVHTA